MKRFVFILVALVALGLPAFADLNLVTNGTFDAGCTSWTAAPKPFNTLGYNECVQSSPNLLADSNHGYFAVLNDYPTPIPTMTQTILGLTVGVQYELTWDMATAYGPYGSSNPGAGVQIDGNTWTFPLANYQGWTAYSETFTYLGGSTALTFSSQLNQTDTDAAIDNVSLTAAVPEPSAFVLLGLCLIGVGSLRRRQLV